MWSTIEYINQSNNFEPRSMQSEDIFTPLLVTLISGLYPLLWLLGPQKATHSHFDTTLSGFPIVLNTCLPSILLCSKFTFILTLLNNLVATSIFYLHPPLPLPHFHFSISFLFPFYLSYSHVLVYSPVLAWAWLFSGLWESHARELWQQNKFILIPTYKNLHTNLYSTINLHSRILLVIQSHFIIPEPSIEWCYTSFFELSIKIPPTMHNWLCKMWNVEF